LKNRRKIMNGRDNFQKFEKGQVIIIVALGLVALIAMAALIVDGAIIMSHRRTAQAAADAAALAGAEYLCPHVYNKTLAETEARDYVTNNNAIVVEPITFPEENVIHVEASVESSSFFARIFNETQLSANAVAEASCTARSTGAATLPVVYPCEAEVQPDGSIICKKKYYDFDLTEQENMENRNYTIIHDSESQLSYCETEGVDCIDVVSAGAKGWVALDADSNKIDMNDWVSGAVKPPEIQSGFWLTSFEGVSNSWYIFLKDYEGQNFLVPIYDAHCESTKPSDYCPTLFLPGDNDDLTDGYGVGQDSYRIVGWGLFKITCVHEKQADACPYRAHLGSIGFDDLIGNSKIKTIEGYFIKGSSTGGGDGEADAGLYTVNLIR
jgi:Flp pilus assembly protein TadG